MLRATGTKLWWVTICSSAGKLVQTNLQKRLIKAHKCLCQLLDAFGQKVVDAKNSSEIVRTAV